MSILTFLAICLVWGIVVYIITHCAFGEACDTRDSTSIVAVFGGPLIWCTLLVVASAEGLIWLGRKARRLRRWFK